MSLYITSYISTIVGEQLLNATAYLSLSANSVVTINAAFERIHETDMELSFEALPSNSPNIPFGNEVQMLYDFVQKLVKVKV